MATLSKKVAVVAGYGTGISAAVSEKFGSEGAFHLALLARTAFRLAVAVAGAGAAAHFRGPLRNTKTRTQTYLSFTHTSQSSRQKASLRRCWLSFEQQAQAVGGAAQD